MDKGRQDKAGGGDFEQLEKLSLVEAKLIAADLSIIMLTSCSYILTGRKCGWRIGECQRKNGQRKVRA